MTVASSLTRYHFLFRTCACAPNARVQRMLGVFATFGVWCYHFGATTPAHTKRFSSTNCYLLRCYHTRCHKPKRLIIPPPSIPSNTCSLSPSRLSLPSLSRYLSRNLLLSCAHPLALPLALVLALALLLCLLLRALSLFPSFSLSHLLARSRALSFSLSGSHSLSRARAVAHARSLSSSLTLSVHEYMREREG